MRVREVGHDGHVPPALHDALENAQRVVRVRVGDESVRPVSHRLGAEADGGDVVEGGVLKDGVDVGGELLRVHDHRVAPGEEDVADVPAVRAVTPAGWGGESLFAGVKTETSL